MKSRILQEKDGQENPGKGARRQPQVEPRGKPTFQVVSHDHLSLS